MGVNIVRIVGALIVIVFLLLIPAKVNACSLSSGESKKDKEIAARMCAVHKDTPAILMMSVQQTILYVDVTRGFYDVMRIKKFDATKLVKTWLRGLRTETGNAIATVWVYADKVKVIEGETTWTGEDKVKFLL